MDHYSPLQRAYYAYLGRALAFTYFSERSGFLGASWAGWLRFLPVLLSVLALILRWGWGWVIFFFCCWLFIRFSYWRARKMGYNTFVPDPAGSKPEPDQTPIDTNEKIAARASGDFALSGRMETVLLRPSEYWHVPSGDHIIMVARASEQFLYQFFTPWTLQFVQKGWILFGEEPLETLAVTFLETWGPDHNNNALQYFVGGGQTDMVKLKPRTVYLTFEQPEALQRTWTTMHAAMRAVRTENPHAE